MRVLILGASGLVGSELYAEAQRREHHILGTYLSCPQDSLKNLEKLEKLDYGDSFQLESKLDEFKPDVVLCAAAKTNVNWIEEHPLEAWEINVIKLNTLLNACAKRSIEVAYFSSDYIFDGVNGPYSEDDIPNPLNFYGKHKLVSEIMLKSLFLEKHYIFRTTWVFGYEKKEKSFLYSVLRDLQAGKELKVPNDMYATLSYTQDIAKCALTLIEKKLYGTYNLSGSEYKSRYDYSKIIAKIFELNSSLLIPVQYSSIQDVANRPLRGGLKNEKVVSATGIQWTSAENALIEIKKQIGRKEVGNQQTREFKKEQTKQNKQKCELSNSNSKICIFIPCYNATVTLPRVFERIPKEVKERVEEVFVVDNDSGDYTYLMAIGYREKKSDIKNLKILKNVKNFGYGGSQKLAYAYAIKNRYDMVVMLHGDAQYAPEKLPVMIEKMESNKSIDLLFGSRMRGNPLKGGMPIHRFLGNKVLTMIQNILLGTKISEFHSGYRIFRTSALSKIPFHLCSNDYHFDTEMIILFIKNKFNIAEVPIDTYYGNEKNYVKIWSYGINVLRAVICYFLQTKGLRNYELYEDKVSADIDRIFKEHKTEIY